MIHFEKPKPPIRDTYEPLGLNEDQIYQLLDEIVGDLREAKNNPRLPQVFYATQNAHFHSRDIVWKIVYFRVDDSEPGRPKLVKGDLETGDYPYTLDLANGSSSIKNALDDRQINLRPLTRLITLPAGSSLQLRQNYSNHQQPMEKSINYIDDKLAQFKQPVNS